jgi:hypothetical protein
MYRRCDWLWGELTLGSVIFQSVFFSLEAPVRIMRARLARLARKAGRVKRHSTDQQIPKLLHGQEQ